MLKAHVTEIIKACVAAFMKARNSLVIWCRERKKQKIVKMFFFKALAKNFLLTWKCCSGDLLPNGLHEKVMICSICYITKSRLDVQLVKKIPMEKFNRWKKRGRIKVNNGFCIKCSIHLLLCYLTRIVINVLRTSSNK